MLKKIAKGTGYLGAGGLLSLYGVTYYHSDSLSHANSRILKAAYRGTNLAIMGTKMACIYTVPIKHFKNIVFWKDNAREAFTSFLGHEVGF